MSGESTSILRGVTFKMIDWEGGYTKEYQIRDGSKVLTVEALNDLVSSKGGWKHTAMNGGPGHHKIGTLMKPIEIKYSVGPTTYFEEGSGVFMEVKGETGTIKIVEPITRVAVPAPSQFGGRRRSTRGRRHQRKLTRRSRSRSRRA
jgi:hypothetical protein